MALALARLRWRRAAAQLRAGRPCAGGGTHVLGAGHPCGPWDSCGLLRTLADSCRALPPTRWHHEDAGIGFNTFRAVVEANASAAVVPMPAHFNDPAVIARTPAALDAYWSSRAVFVHGIKDRSASRLK